MRLIGRERSRGQALVEFAIAAPVVFLVLLGLFDVGRLVFINNELTEAAREGARWGAVQGRAAAQVNGYDSAVSDQVKAHITISPIPTIALTCTDMGGAGGSCGSGDLLTLDVDVQVSPITPLIGNIIGPLDLGAEAQMTIH